MTTTYLSDEIVGQLKCPDGQAHREVFDALIKGLYVDVQPNGRMSWRLRWYERIEGTYPKKVMTLGSAHVMTVDEARQAARSALRRIMVGADPRSEDLPGTGPSFASFIEEQYLPYVKTYKLSWKTDESTLRTHVIPVLGEFPLGQITVPQFARLVQGMTTQGLAPGTVNKVLIFLRYAYKLAMRWKVEGVTHNPVTEIPNLRDDYKIERYLSHEQMRDLLEAVRSSDNPMLQFIIPFLIYTGARKREVLDARWVDVDWERKSWRIPKTKSGKVRHVPLSTGALEVLNRLRPGEDREGANLQDFIFANPRTGRPYVSIYYSWHTARCQVDLADLRIHDLRHSFASFLVNAGRSLYEVQELLGHASIKTTSRYAHLSQERLAQAVEVIPSSRKPGR